MWLLYKPAELLSHHLHRTLNKPSTGNEDAPSYIGELGHSILPEHLNPGRLKLPFPQNKPDHSKNGGDEQATAVPKSLEAKSEDLTDSSGDWRVLKRPHLRFSELGNYILSGNVDDVDAKRNTEGKSVEKLIAGNKNEGNE